jgi:hypothetical protein
MEECLVFDLERRIKFLQYFIRRSEDTMLLAQLAKERPVTAFSEPLNVTFQTKRPGDSDASNSKECRFTGSVFIYAESEMTAEQIGELTREYRSAGLLLQLRGSDYLSTEKLRIQVGTE